MSSQGEDAIKLQNYKAELVAVEQAIFDFAKSGGVVEYKLDTGQSVQEVRRSMSDLYKIRMFLSNEINVLQDNLNCGRDSTTNVF